MYCEIQIALQNTLLNHIIHSHITHYFKMLTPSIKKRSLYMATMVIFLNFI